MHSVLQERVVVAECAAGVVDGECEARTRSALLRRRQCSLRATRSALHSILHLMADLCLSQSRRAAAMSLLPSHGMMALMIV